MMASPPNAVQFVVGNTYSKVPLSEAKLDHSGKYRKIHDWTLFVDVIEGNPDDVIDHVSFDLGPSFLPRTFTCSTPVPKRGNIWSFQTRQQTYGPVTASIQIRGVGGSVLECSHKIQFTTNAHSPVHTFREIRNPRPQRMLRIPDDACFGIELELTSAVHIPPETVAQNLESATIRFEVMVNDYRAGRATSCNWKLVPDSSIVCNTSMPNCNRFELVSPILMGGGGLNQVSQILKRLHDYIRREPHIQLSVNKSMGFHVHINVADLSHEELIKVCQNFVKYENVMDTFVPPSRRNGSPESNRFFKSNRACVAQTIGSNRNKAIHEALGACRNTVSRIATSRLLNFDSTRPR
jgi:hypothetical protein